MKKYVSRFFKTLAFLTPLLCGLIGLVVLEQEPFLDALFCSMLMYFLNYSDTPPNILIEIARWTAPLATASGILLAIVSLQESLVNRVKYLRGDSVAVYGGDEEKTEILAQLGRRGIDGKDRFVRAQRYLLLDGEEQNLAFYRQHQALLADRMVYLKCRSLQAQSVANAGLKLFCPEETAARLFWKQRELYPISVQAGHRLRIMLLGFGKLGEELLFWGLQNNIFAPNQRIEYHVFGDAAPFLAIHTGLGQISDPVICHAGAWYDELALVEQADLVIVLEQEEQLALLRDLLLATNRPEIDVFAAEASAVELLDGSARLRLYDWEQTSRQLSHIFDDLLFERAKRINLRYCSLYSGVPENEQTKQEEWGKLGAFTRYSNISSADYHEVRLQMLRSMGQPEDGNALSAACLELLAELEHIRWCRYHYLSNWRYGVPENGSRKDAEKRIHADLVPYGELKEGEKEKDRENIRILLSVRDA